jgi:hypothetical protein
MQWLLDSDSLDLVHVDDLTALLQESSVQTVIARGHEIQLQDTAD